MALLAMLAVAPALAAADIAVLLSLRATASSEVDHDLVAQAALLQSGMDDSNGRLSFGGAGDTGTVTASGAIVRPGTVVSRTGRDPLPDAVATSVAARAAATQSTAFADTRNAAGASERVYATPIGGTDHAAELVLVVNRSVATLATAQGQTLLIAVLLSAFILLLTGVVARWLAGRVLRPVQTIAGLARTISEKDLHRRVAAAVPNDELGELVATVNAMLQRLETAFDALQHFTADASHELRAPLSIMRGELELSLARPRAVADYRQSQRRLLREVQHLTRLADRLLLLARADAGTLLAERQTVDVNDLVTEIAERWRTAAARRHVSIAAETNSAGSFSADPDLLRQLLDNVVDNAIKHAPAETAVTVRATQTAGGLEVDVADEGPGVAVQLRPLLFDRFFRASRARTPGATVGGAGLGLAVSGSIARAHAGELRYVETPSGALFRLWLPTPGTG